MFKIHIIIISLMIVCAIGFFVLGASFLRRGTIETNVERATDSESDNEARMEKQNTATQGTATIKNKRNNIQKEAAIQQLDIIGDICDKNLMESTNE